MVDLNLKYEKLFKFLNDEIPFNPELTLILGSGLGDFADSIEVIKSIPTSEIPDYPLSTVEGHKGYLHFAEIHGKKVLLFQGRIHVYEGYSIDKCILPALIGVKIKTKKMLITNAAGGINSHFKPGDLMLVTGFLAHNIKQELSQILSHPTAEQRLFLNDLPSKNFNELILNAALEEKIYLQRGTYWFGKGPSYETPAEIRMQKYFGADSVGMSTVHEAIFAGFNGVKVSSISLITNYAAGLSQQKLSHSEVIETADAAKEKFIKLVNKIIELI